MRFIGLFFFLIPFIYAQNPQCFTIEDNGNVLDGVYMRERPNQLQTIAYPYLREGDVMWLKRIWQVIDLREKINHPLYFPIENILDRKSLTQVMYQSVMNTSITPYSSIDDEFTVKLTLSEVKDLTTSYELIYVENEFGEYDSVPVIEEFESADVKRYRIKEEWFFDNQRSVLDARIIGICPITEKFDESGEFKGELPLFWVYFPEARCPFTHAPVYAIHNDAERITLDQLFMKRRFSSYIYKESNVYDRKIQQYKLDLDLLLEGKKIENFMFNFEQDLWEY